jgi:PhnB protein
VDEGVFVSKGQHAASKTKTSIAPMLSVRRGARAIEFYKAAFGAGQMYRVDAPDGEVVARLSVDGADFWVADESPEHANFSPESLGGGTVRMVLVVDDPDAAFDGAVKAGARVVAAVANQHGWRLGRVVDPYGHHWENRQAAAPINITGKPRGSRIQQQIIAAGTLPRDWSRVRSLQ